METDLKRTWAEIDLDALAHNFETLRAHLPAGTKMLAVIKADGYGHGAVRLAEVLKEHDAAYFAVANADEAEQLRKGGVTLPILILGFTPPDQAKRLLQFDITQCVPDIETARAYRDALKGEKKKLKIHVKLDTGMSRLGFRCDDARFDESLSEIREMLSFDCFEAEGIFTHFSVSDEEGASDHDYTNLQHDRFVRMYEAVEEQTGHVFSLHHCANSGAIAQYPQFAHDMARCGIILYGAGDLAAPAGCRPVMTLKSAVASVKEYGPETCVSYGRTYVTKDVSRIAVLPVGYADGLFRSLSGKLIVKTPYGDAPQVGRVCMDMCMIDVTAYPEIRIGDEVTVFGAENTVTELAKQCGTISYELLCAVSKRVPRLYYRDGNCIARDLTILAGM